MSEKLSPYEFVHVITDIVIKTSKTEWSPSFKDWFDSTKILPEKEWMESVDTYDFSEEGKIYLKQDGGEDLTIEFVHFSDDGWPFGDTNE